MRTKNGGLDRALAQARARGVRVRIVTEVAASNRTEVRLFSHVAELRHARRPVTNRAIVIDRKAAAVFVTGAEGLGASEEAQLMLWTTDPRFLALTRAYHQRLWALSVPISVREAELDRVPYIVVVGDREIADGSVAVRVRGTKGSRTFSRAEFLAHVSEKVRKREFDP